MKIIIKINELIIVLFFISFLSSKCDGFNWYHDINLNDCSKDDLNVLQEFINNSISSINLEMDVNLNNKVDPIELGWQLWDNGRLVHWICDDVPSPFYIYNYGCGLSGKIPDNINELDSIIKLHLQYNNLEGSIPESICDLEISNSSHYWFKIDNNKLCPPYPKCIEELNANQNKFKCD